MSETPSWVLILSGIAISFLSWYIGEKFWFFFYVGLIFIVYGIFKWYINRDDKIEEVRTKEIQKETQMMHQHTKFNQCKNCGSIVKPADNFCYKCGSRLR
jgi:cadmium resistance protein CadD (predicted permease)